jgi:hypothetical protein
MAKGDKVIVKSEIGGQLVEEVVEVTAAGQKLDVDNDGRRGLLTVEILNRNEGKTGVKHTFALSAVRSIHEFRREAEER